MKYYKKTGIKCPYCNTELKLYEDIYRDEEGLKDVDYFFECPNGCDYDFSEMSNYENEITRIVTESLPDNIFCDQKMKCKKCGGPYPCPKHTIIIDEKTGNIKFPSDVTEEQKQRAKDIRNAFRGEK